MIFYSYSWKGPKEHLLGCYVTYCCNFNSELEDDYMESIVPVSKANIYFPRNQVDELFSYVNKWFWKETTFHQINSEGDYALHKNKLIAENTLRSGSRSSYVDVIKKAGCWQHRLTMIYAITVWRTRMAEYTHSYLRHCDLKYEELERDRAAHKEYLRSLYILPDIYVWEKAIKLFESDVIKPIWYKKEIDLYNKLIGE